MPEYESHVERLPAGVRRKEFDFSVYELATHRPRRRAIAGSTSTSGCDDDLNVVRFHAKEEADGPDDPLDAGRSRSSRLTDLTRGEREARAVMNDGGRPGRGAAGGRDVRLHGRALLGTVGCVDGFQAYAFQLPPAVADGGGRARTTPVRLITRTPPGTRATCSARRTTASSA